MAIILFAVSFISGYDNKPSNINLIPEPLELKVNSGSFMISVNTKIIVDSDDSKMKDVANYFVEHFNYASGYSIRVVSSSEKNDIKNSIIKVTEYSSNGKHGPVYEVDYIKQIPLKPALVKREKEGLSFEYYEFEKPIDSILDLLKMEPVKKGIVPDFVFPYEDEKLPYRQVCIK